MKGETKFEDLSPADRREVVMFRRYLKLKATKWGRNILRTQQFWKDYQGALTLTKVEL